MKEQNNPHISDEQLSRFLDNELNPDSRQSLENHLKTCDFCSNRMEQFKLVRKNIYQYQKRELPSHIWHNIKHDIQPSEIEKTTFFLSNTFNKLSAAAVILIIMLVGFLLVSQSTRHGIFSGCTRMAAVQDTSAIDYGLYLTGLNQPAVMNRFVKTYNRKPVSVTHFINNESNKSYLTPLKNLGAELGTAYLLSNNSIQINLNHSNGQITVFKQPIDHPLRFSGYKMNDTKIDSTECTKVESDQHEALMFHSQEVQYVVIGQKQDPMLTAVFDQLTNTH